MVTLWWTMQCLTHVSQQFALVMLTEQYELPTCSSACVTTLDVIASLMPKIQADLRRHADWLSQVAVALWV